MTTQIATDCRSEEGITIGLIDALISVGRVLAIRNLNREDVKEALKDLASDEDLQHIFQVARSLKQK